jgi:hypothetical protein
MTVLTKLDYSAENKVTKVIGVKKFNGEVRFGIYPPLKPLCVKSGHRQNPTIQLVTVPTFKTVP